MQRVCNRIPNEYEDGINYIETIYCCVTNLDQPLLSNSIKQKLNIERFTTTSEKELLELVELVDLILSSPVDDITQKGLGIMFVFITQCHKNLNEHNIGQIMYSLETILNMKDRKLPLSNLYEYKKNQNHYSFVKYCC